MAGKIIITFLFACGAIFLSLYISRFTFGKVLSTVKELSTPNVKMQLVNTLFRKVVTLDHLQRSQALKLQVSNYDPFLKESRELQLMLDSLKDMSRNNGPQVLRIDSMKKILFDRDILFLTYIKLRTEMVRNDTLAGQVRNLAELIENARVHLDSNLVTSSRAVKTIIDTIAEEDVRQSLWKRIFYKKKAKIKQVKKQIVEVLDVQVDTLGMAGPGDSLAKMGRVISQTEQYHVARRDQLRKRQAELNLTGDVLIGQLISILNEIERDELARAASQSALANSLVNRSLQNINIVLVVFVLGIAILIVLIFADLWQANHYRRQLIAAKEEAEEAGLVKQRFLANMSHELRTPLQTILGTAEQVRERHIVGGRELENIYQSSVHLLQIVNEVLDYSRITSGKLVLEKKTFNMYRVLHEVIEMIQVQLDIKGLEFHSDIDVPEDAWFTGDPFRLKQLLLNLLGNAVKFTDEGGVWLSAREMPMPGNPSTFTFVIRDSGPGISDQDLAVIFNQFEQGSSKHNKQGTGLGLSIVKAIVDIQNGTITTDSVPGKGTSFTVTIPYAVADAIAAEPAAPAPEMQHAGHVWIVDDDLFILQLCSSIMNKYKITHTCFSSARLAVDTPFPKDLTTIFLDIRMAEMDGITLCAKLKEREVQNPPDFVALTAEVLPDERESILQMGFDRLVMKPFLEQDLLNAIARRVVLNDDDKDQPFNLSALRKMTGNDPELLQHTLQRFITETENDLAAIVTTVQLQDFNELAELFHRLASRLGQLGIPLSRRVRTLELELRRDTSTAPAQHEIDEIIIAMQTAIRSVSATLRE